MTETGHSDRIPATDPQLSPTAKEAVLRVLNSGPSTAGTAVDEFEVEFAEFCDTAHGVATTNRTAALQTALEAVEIGEGDRVITTPFGRIAPANAVRFTGAEPVFADIDPETYTLDPEAVESTIQDCNGTVDGILVAHLYGLPAEMNALAEIANRYDVPLIEDAIQGHGARYRGRSVGAIGDVGCFSVYPRENRALGEGGMIVTDRDDIASRARQCIEYGRVGEHEAPRHSYRMSDITAALGRVQLDRVPTSLEARRKNARRLQRRLAETDLVVPTEPGHVTHAYTTFTVRCPHRDRLRMHLETFGVDSSVYYPQPIHDQKAYRKRSATLPVAERAADEVLSLPIHPMVSVREIDTIAEAIKYFESYVR